jgi:hypothetical protein
LCDLFAHTCKSNLGTRRARRSGTGRPAGSVHNKHHLQGLLVNPAEADPQGQPKPTPLSVDPGQLASRRSGNWHWPEGGLLVRGGGYPQSGAGHSLQSSPINGQNGGAQKILLGVPKWGAEGLEGTLLPSPSPTLPTYSTAASSDQATRPKKKAALPIDRFADWWGPIVFPHMGCLPVVLVGGRPGSAG